MRSSWGDRRGNLPCMATVSNSRVTARVRFTLLCVSVRVSGAKTMSSGEDRRRRRAIELCQKQCAATLTKPPRQYAAINLGSDDHTHDRRDHAHFFFCRTSITLCKRTAQCAFCFPNSTWIVTSRLDTTRHVRRVERVETSVSSRAFDKHDTAKMHGLDTSNVSCRDETWRDEPSGIWATFGRSAYTACCQKKTLTLTRVLKFSYSVFSVLKWLPLAQRH